MCSSDLICLQHLHHWYGKSDQQYGWSMSAKNIDTGYQKSWSIGNVNGIKQAKTFRMYIFFQKYIYNGSEWEATRERLASIIIVAIGELSAVLHPQQTLFRSSAVLAFVADVEPVSLSVPSWFSASSPSVPSPSPL